MASPVQPNSRNHLFAKKQGVTPKQPRVCRLHIHLGEDTHCWQSLSAQYYNPGDLSATTRPAVNWVYFMKPAGDYLQPKAPWCLCTMLKIYLSNFALPILGIGHNNGADCPCLTTAYVMLVRALEDLRELETNTHDSAQSEVKLIHFNCLCLHLHLSFLVISASFHTFSCFADVYCALTRHPVSLHYNSIVLFQSGSL